MNQLYRFGLLSYRYNGAFVPVVRYPSLRGVALRQLFQGGRDGNNSVLLKTIAPAFAATSLSSPGFETNNADSAPTRLQPIYRFSSDTTGKNDGPPTPRGARTASSSTSATGIKTGIKPPPKASELKLKKNRPKLSDVSQEKRVPTGRVERLASYTGLAAGLAVGGLAEMTKRAVGYGSGDSNSLTDASVLLNPANAERIVNTLCRVRGAALKMGQMLSIADNSLICK